MKRKKTSSLDFSIMIKRGFNHYRRALALGREKKSMDYDIKDLTIGQLRELIAYADADLYVRDAWEYVDEEDLERVGFDPYEDEEDECFCDDEDEDYEDEDEDCEDEDDDFCDDDDCEYGALDNPEEEELAQSIAADINAGRYTYDVVYGMYPEHIVKRIEELA